MLSFLRWQHANPFCNDQAAGVVSLDVGSLGIRPTSQWGEYVGIGGHLCQPPTKAYANEFFPLPGGPDAQARAWGLVVRCSEQTENS